MAVIRPPSSFAPANWLYVSGRDQRSRTQLALALGPESSMLPIDSTFMSAMNNNSLRYENLWPCGAARPHNLPRRLAKVNRPTTAPDLMPDTRWLGFGIGGSPDLFRIISPVVAQTSIASGADGHQLVLKTVVYSPFSTIAVLSS